MNESFEEVSDLFDPGLGKVGSVLALSGAEAYQSSMLLHGFIFFANHTSQSELPCFWPADLAYGL